MRITIFYVMDFQICNLSEWQKLDVDLDGILEATMKGEADRTLQINDHIRHQHCHLKSWYILEACCSKLSTPKTAGQKRSPDCDRSFRT